MAEEVITVDGEDKLVREDEAKSYRGVRWAMISIFGFIMITAVLFVVFFAGAEPDGEMPNPSQIEQPKR